MTSLFIMGVGLYFLLMVLIGLLASSRIKTLEDYLIAGRKLPFFLAVPTIVATWFGAGSCMGVSGTVYNQGFYGVMADPFGCSLALIITGLFFAIPFRRLGLLTISDVLYKAYGSIFERLATTLTIPFYIGTLAANLLGIGYIFQIVTGMDVQWGVLLGTSVVLMYTVTGGMWAVTLTDFVQFGILTIGLLLLIPICFEQVDNMPLVSKTFFHEFTTLIPKTSSSNMWLSYLGRIFMTGLGAIMGQDIIQRLLACRTEKVARSSALTGGVLYLAMGLIPLFVGIAGRDILPGLEKAEQLIPLLAKQYLSPFAFTVFACGLLAAIMSTADSYLLAGTSLVVNNIILKIYPVKTEKNKIRILRLTNILFCIVALMLALSGPSIFDLMVHSGATLFVAIFVPTTAALFWKSANRFAAWSSLIGGLCAWIGFLYFNYDSFASQYEDLLFSAAFSGGVISLVVYVCAHCLSVKWFNSNNKISVSVGTT